jgi:hypothetical protein
MKLKTFFSLIIVAALLFPAVTATAQNAPPQLNIKTVLLFNGKDLSNWEFKLKDPEVKPSEVFGVKDGVIQIKGDPFGYMRTKDVYSDYLLHVEWRWPGEATNSGVFVHAQLPDTIFPKCIECQLQAGNAGDFICANGSDMNERIDKSIRKIKKAGDSSEKPAGEWNTMEVSCKGNTIEVYVNGVLKNKGTSVNPSKGFICLQSEGKLVEFRNVWLRQEKK